MNTRKLTWDEMYEKAKQYFLEHGNLLPPQTYICEDGTKLGAWINTQRAVNNGIRPGIINEYRKAKLDEIGMDWAPNQTVWAKAYDELKIYFVENKHINVPLRYKTATGFKLGLWLQNQRRSYLKKGRGALNSNQINLLLQLGIVWDPIEEQWNKAFALLKQFYETHGNLNIPQGLIVDGVELKRWLDTQRGSFRGVGKGTISDEQIEKLNQLGVEWELLNELKWNKRFKLAEQYYLTYGHLVVLSNYEVENENLGFWIRFQRTMKKLGRLAIEKINKLDSIGMIWDYQSQQQTSFNEQAILFYIKQVFDDSRGRDRSNGMEFDIYIPSIKVGIEYDGMAFHNKNKATIDNEKNQKCKELGITLYRIREIGCYPLNDETNSFYIDFQTTNDLAKAINWIIGKISKDKKLSIDVNRDSGKIFSQYMLIGPSIAGKDDPNNYLLSTEWMDFLSSDIETDPSNDIELTPSNYFRRAFFPAFTL